jgi:hypothetical protein
VPAAGAVYASEVAGPVGEAGWMTVSLPGADGTTGFILTRDGSRELVERFAQPAFDVSGSIWQLAAGPTGYLAIGTAAGSSTAPAPATLFASPDGVTWLPVSDPPPGACCMAWGPAGWILAGDPAGVGDTWIWQSADGASWESRGQLRAGGPTSLQASGTGYLLSGWSPLNGELESWFSRDGLRWVESDPNVGDQYQATATSLGFYASSDPACCRRRTAFSTDGLTWSPVDGPASVRVAAVGGRLLGLETDPQSGAVRAIAATIAGDELSWQPMAAGEGLFDGAIVTALTTDGASAIALGVDRATEVPRLWTSDGESWTEASLDGAFTGPPTLAAGGELGVVVVGHRWNVRGDNPVFWHLDPAGRWTVEREPVLGLAREPSTADCAPPLRDAVEFVQRDWAAAVVCHPGAAVTFRAFSTPCPFCAASPSGTYEQGWLAFPRRNTLYLSPVRETEGSWYANAVVSPSLAPSVDPTWTNTWVELTGHFDDPAALSCHWTPPPAELAWYAYSGSRQVVESCREQFVVTAVEIVDGP